MLNTAPEESQAVSYIKTISRFVIFRALSANIVDEAMQWQFVLMKFGSTFCKRPARILHRCCHIYVQVAAKRSWTMEMSLLKAL